MLLFRFVVFIVHALIFRPSLSTKQSVLLVNSKAHAQIQPHLKKSLRAVLH